MLDFDNLREIWSTIKKSKLRTFLTGFSVSWGIFMLIVLLGAGNGLGNGIAHNFRNMGENTVMCWPRYTTRPYKGFQSNRRIQFTEKDVFAIKREHPEVHLISPVNFRSDTLSYGNESMNVEIEAVYPDYASITYVPILPGGRFINGTDLIQRRKVIVLTPRIAEVLFRDTTSPVGRYIKVGGLMFQVIGIYKNENSNDNSPPAYMPFTTGQTLYENGYGIGNIRFTIDGVDTEAASDAFEARFRARMARRHQYDPSDTNALGMWNTGNEFRMWRGMTNGIALFIWIVGLGTLMAGIVGVSNIMLISVRERTKEFGIRKALGAKPSSILKLIIIESVLVTAVFGYIGMISGIGLTELINYSMEMAGGGGDGGSNNTPTIFRNPTVSLGISLAATGVLIVAGVVAGYFPARKAVKISAVEAMRMEN